MTQATAIGEPRYPHVFEPIRLGPVEIPNRIYMGPHGLPLEVPVAGQTSLHEPAAELAHYFVERAKGGTGLIFHSTLLGPFAGIGDYIHQTPALAEAIPSYSRIADLVHDSGAKIMAEIWYLPWVSHKWDALGPSAPSLAPSATPFFYPAIPATMYAMRKHDIKQVIETHRVAAGNLRKAGYDGVELHLSHGSILEYFLSSYHNRRGDEYGGAAENRWRLILQILEVIREAAGTGMAIGVRTNADQMLPGGLNQEDEKAIISHLVSTGLIDFVDVDIAVEPEQEHLVTSSYLERSLHNVERVRRVGPAAKPLPLLATPGRLTSIADAEGLLRDGVVDMVGVVRGLIAEPELVKNARDGNEHRDRICIGANHCIHNNASSEGWGCAINAAAGREERWGTGAERRAPTAMRVVVVGAGPAGLEAARILAKRGHQVTLLEREALIGGALNLWGRIPGRESVLTFPAWAAARLGEYGVDVRTGVNADRRMVLDLKPDAVFIATGSRYEQSGEGGSAPWPIPGCQREFVHTPEVVIQGGVQLIGRVIVFDDEGLHAGVGVAEIAGRAGANVELVTRMPVPGMNIPKDLPYVISRLQSSGVNVSSMTYIKEIGDRQVTLAHAITQQERVVDAVDAVILVTMRRPVDHLADELEDDLPFVYLIGDALAPRGLREATYEGHRFARIVGEAEMPKHTTDELYRPLNSLRRAELA